MHRAIHSRTTWLATALLLLVAVGCAEGPFGLVALNPWARKNWAEDEKYGPTFHRRIADLRALRPTVQSLDPGRQQQLMVEMSELAQADESVVLRSEALAILAEIGSPEVLPVIHASMLDPDPDIRVAACQAWGRLGGPDALNALAEAAQNEADVDVRIAAVDELGKFKDELAMQVLGKALDDNDPAVQYRAVQSLKASTGMSYGDSVPGWRDYIAGREAAPPPPPSVVQRVREWF